MFVARGHLPHAGAGCTCSPRKSRACPRRTTAVASAQPLRRVRVVLAPRCKNGLPTEPPHPTTTRNNLSKMSTYAERALTPVECALTKSLNLKSRAMNTYEKGGRGESYCYPDGTRATQTRRLTGCSRNLAFPITSALFVCSFACVQVSLRGKTLCYALVLHLQWRHDRDAHA
jgi:hypothetical protein